MDKGTQQKNNSPEVWRHGEPDPEHRPCDGLDGGLDVDERDLEGGLLDVVAGAHVVDEVTDFLPVHLAQIVQREVAILELAQELGSVNKNKFRIPLVLKQVALMLIKSS